MQKRIDCPYCKGEIQPKDKSCELCGTIFMPTLSKNKSVIYLQEINGNIRIPLARIAR